LDSAETQADYLRLIAEGCLTVLLPTEDLDSDCERTLIREILASLIFRKALDLMSEPYMMYETIHNVPHSPLFCSRQVIRIQTQRRTESPPVPLIEKLWSWISYFNPYARSQRPGTPDTYRPRRQTLTEMSIFKLFSELLSFTNRQTILIRQISAVLPLLIHGPIRIFFQKYPFRD
jgi:PXA domain